MCSTRNFIWVWVNQSQHSNSHTSEQPTVLLIIYWCPTFCVSSFFSCFRVSVRFTSLSMASTYSAHINNQPFPRTNHDTDLALTCLLRCFRYMPQALQNASSSRPKRWDTVLLCISDLWQQWLMWQTFVSVTSSSCNFLLTLGARRRSVLFSDWSELSWSGNEPKDCPGTSHTLRPADRFKKQWMNEWMSGQSVGWMDGSWNTIVNLCPLCLSNLVFTSLPTSSPASLPWIGSSSVPFSLSTIRCHYSFICYITQVRFMEVLDPVSL